MQNNFYNSTSMKAMGHRPSLTFSSKQGAKDGKAKPSILAISTQPVFQPPFKVQTGMNRGEEFQRIPFHTEHVVSKKKNERRTADGATKRRELWIREIQKHPELMQNLVEGTFTKTNRNIMREKSENANIYVRKYMPSKDRAELAQILFEQGHQKLPFSEADPFKRPFLRPEQKQTQFH